MSAHERERERLAAAEELRRTRNATMFQGRAHLRFEDVPLASTYDKCGPELVRACVYWWAKTGDWDYVCDEVGMQRVEVRRLMERAAARELILLMIEEGTWPEGAPTGGRVYRGR